VLNTAVVVFFGGAIGWLVLLPLYQAIVGSPEGLIGVAAAKATWSGQIRYIGIGAMLVGWSLDPVSGARPDLAESATTHGAVRRPQPIR
jgi:uncharacterized oligopeptide transporter (OPT) family protein